MMPNSSLLIGLCSSNFPTRHERRNTPHQKSLQNEQYDGLCSGSETEAPTTSNSKRTILQQRFRVMNTTEVYSENKNVYDKNTNKLDDSRINCRLRNCYKLGHFRINRKTTESKRFRCSVRRVDATVLATRQTFKTSVCDHQASLHQDIIIDSAASE